jgi:hypothetical protein
MIHSNLERVSRNIVKFSGGRLCNVRIQHTGTAQIDAFQRNQEHGCPCQSNAGCCGRVHELATSFVPWSHRHHLVRAGYEGAYFLPWSLYWTQSPVSGWVQRSRPGIVTIGPDGRATAHPGRDRGSRSSHSSQDSVTCSCAWCARTGA